MNDAGVLIGRGVGIFFYNGRERKEENRKGTEKTGMQALEC